MAIKDCCKDPNNLKITEQSADRVTRTCSVCNCRHFEFEVEAGFIGITMADGKNATPYKYIR